MSDTQYTASRQSESDTSSTSLAPAYEDRLIILAQGKQFQDEDYDGDGAVPYLQNKLPNLVVADNRHMTYIDDIQHVNFTIRRVTTKSDFVDALKTAGAHVVYSGHARLGQGPCFGDSPADRTADFGEAWGGHSNSADTGIFRAAFPYVGLPIDEIASEHRYTVDPVNASDDKPSRSDCHPHAREQYGAFKKFSIDDLTAKANATSDVVTGFLSNANQGDTFWGYDAIGESGKQERHVLCKCDWQNTSTIDLGSVDPACRAFICIGCSTFIHNYPVFRKLKDWTLDRAGNDRYAYWTTRVTYSMHMSKGWLFRILSYPKRNDFQSWEPSLEYAKKMANRDYQGYSPQPSSLI